MEFVRGALTCPRHTADASQQDLLGPATVLGYCCRDILPLETGDDFVVQSRDISSHPGLESGKCW